MTSLKKPNITNLPELMAPTSLPELPPVSTLGGLSNLRLKREEARANERVHRALLAETTQQAKETGILHIRLRGQEIKKVLVGQSLARTAATDRRLLAVAITTTRGTYSDAADTVSAIALEEAERLTRLEAAYRAGNVTEAGYQRQKDLITRSAESLSSYAESLAERTAVAIGQSLRSCMGED